MNLVAAKQAALDNALVPLEKRLKIENCNARIELLNQDFVEPPYEDELVPFIQELGYSDKCDMLSIHTDQMHQPWRTFAAIINRCISGKTTGLDRLRESRAQILKLSLVLEEEPTLKAKRAKRPAKKSTTMPTVSVVIRDTPSESVPNKKTPAKVVRGKGMDLLFDVALLGAAQPKKTLKKIKLETHKLHASGLGDGVASLPKVSDEQEDKSIDSGDDDDNDDDRDEVTKDDDDDDVDSDANDDKEASDSEKTDSDKDKNPNLNQNDDEEKEYEEEYVRTLDSFEFTEDDEEYKELYKYVNVRLKDTAYEEHKKGDEEMTDAGRDDVPLQSLSVSFDFANHFLDLDNIPPTDTEVVSMMNVNVRHEEPSTQNPPLLNIPVTVILETSTATGSTIPLTIPLITPLPQHSAPTSTPTQTTATTVTLIPTIPDFHPCLDSIKEFLPWKKSFLNSIKLTILHNCSKQ
ncbi:hypothetical protein Tco_1288803 [Tanacetum coccineum]